MSTRKRTVLRTVRLAQEMDRKLQEDAEANGMTVNGLMNKILTKYIKWDTHIEKFKFVSITNETFKFLLEECSDSEIERIATASERKAIEDITLFWFHKLNLETALKTASIYSRYSGLLTSETKVDEGNYTITFHHDLGEKWSLFLKCVINQFFKTVLGIVPQIQISDNVVLVSFYSPLSMGKNRHYLKGADS